MAFGLYLGWTFRLPVWALIALGIVATGALVTAFVFRQRWLLALCLVCTAVCSMTLAVPAWYGERYDAYATPIRAQVVASSETAMLLDHVSLDVATPMEGRLSVSASVAEEVYPEGTWLTAEVVLIPPEDPAFPGDFDQRQYDLTRGVRARVIDMTVTSAESEPLTGLKRFRQARLEELDAFMVSSLQEDARALMRALLLGERDGLTYEARNAFNALGIAHLLAISGLHISLCLMLVDLLCRTLHLGRMLRSVMGMVMVAIYVFYAGFSMTVARAVLMYLVAEGAFFARRRYDPVNSLGAAATILMVADPLTILNVGFQLSCLAVGGLVLFSGMAQWTERLPHALRKPAQGVLISVQASLLTWPILGRQYHLWTVAAPLFNLIFVPWTTAILGLMLLCMLLVLLGLPAAWIAAVLDPVCSMLIMAVRLTDRLVPLMYATACRGWAAWLAVGAIALCSERIMRWPHKHRWIPIATALGMAVVALCPLPQPAQICVIGSYQGNELLLCHQGAVAVVTEAAPNHAIQDYAASGGIPEALITMAPVTLEGHPFVQRTALGAGETVTWRGFTLTRQENRVMVQYDHAELCYVLDAQENEPHDLVIKADPGVCSDQNGTVIGYSNYAVSIPEGQTWLDLQKTGSVVLTQEGYAWTIRQERNTNRWIR